MARHFVDISAPLQTCSGRRPGSASDRTSITSKACPSAVLQASDKRICRMGEDRRSNAWRTTHNGAHLDAPWHYHPTMNEGARGRSTKCRSNGAFSRA